MIVTKYSHPHLTAKQRDAKQELECIAEARRAKMRELPVKQCLWCKKEFRPVKSWQKFHSNVCRMKNWNKNNEND